ncbi:MAG: hypothetical protein ACTH8F_07625 [Microbacterium sp.]|uniref:hypothetical protein n=1 Tax=Microbacterium sp. TaxID=51671 RepID=UPI003F9AE3EA
MTIRKRTAAVFVAGVLLLAGCTAEPEPAASPTAPTSTGDDHGDHDVLVPVPTESPDLDAAATAAVDALTAFAHRDLEYVAWFDQLKPHLHPSAVEAYSTVNPSRMPVIEIQDGAEAAATSTATYAVVYVPTSVGDYTIELRRDGADASWGVTRFEPPA